MSLISNVYIGFDAPDLIWVQTENSPWDKKFNSILH